MKSALVLAAIAALVLALGGAPARAHDETVSASVVTATDRLLVWKVDVGLQGLEKKVKLPALGPDLTEASLQQAKAAIAAYLVPALTVELDGERVTPTVGTLEPRYEPFIATGEPMITRVVLELRYAPAQDIGQVRALLAFFADLTARHRAVITVSSGGQTRQFVRHGVAELSFTHGRLNPSTGGLMGEFLVWGMHHIFIGYDHIAFLLALLLVASRLGELFKIVTSFTVAHSLTLLLAAFEIIRLPSRITEALIAVSIVYVAADNLLRKAARHRWLLTFVFGLIHGMGFAGELRQRLADMPGRVLLPVLSFNLGVELGQVIIVAAVFPALYWLRRAPDTDGRQLRQRRLVAVGSVPILVLGLHWLVQRLVGDG